MQGKEREKTEMKVGFRSVAMAAIIMLALASASFAATITLHDDTAADQPVSFCAGAVSQVLDVSAEGSNLHYQWKKGTENVGTDSATYTAEAEGVYKVVVTGDCGEVTSSTCTITLKTATKIN